MVKQIAKANGDLVDIEIKATASVQAQHLRGLNNLAKNAGSNFKMGILLYDGTETLPLGNQMWAAPISSLWGV